MVRIYLVHNAVNNKLYVGKTRQKLHRRWAHHVSHAPQNDYHFHRAICKYGSENFTIQEISVVETDEQANNLERLWIVLLQTYDPEIGYNGTYGGDGVPHTEASREKLSKAMTGLPRPESARQKLSQAYQGAGNPRFGKPVSDETRRKMRESGRRAWAEGKHKNTP